MCNAQLHEFLNARKLQRACASMDQLQPAAVDEEEEAFPQGRRCYVGNLAWRTSWQDLKDHFKPCGTVVYANVMQDGSGAAFVTLALASQRMPMPAHAFDNLIAV